MSNQKKPDLENPMGDGRTADQLSEEERQKAADELDPADLGVTGGPTDMIGTSEEDEP